jgi:hypothetical protein
MDATSSSQGNSPLILHKRSPVLKKLFCFSMLSVLLMGTPGCSNAKGIGQGSAQSQGELLASAKTLDYTDYATILKQYVNADGLVDYARLKANRQILDRFVGQLGAVQPQTYQSWSSNDKLAFLLNAYNALTLKAIIDHYPVKSIKDIPGVWSRTEYQVAGQSVTLDGIEHQTIRKQFKEPRIHMAVNCASLGCPLLANQPYQGSTLDAQLQKQVQRTLADPRHFRIDRAKNKVYLSSVFNWFGEDWEKTAAPTSPIPGLNRRETAFINFIRPQINPEDQQYLQRGKFHISYIDWDWSLNVQR